MPSVTTSQASSWPLHATAAQDMQSLFAPPFPETMASRGPLSCVRHLSSSRLLYSRTQSLGFLCSEDFPTQWHQDLKGTLQRALVILATRLFQVFARYRVLYVSAHGWAK